MKKIFLALLLLMLCESSYSQLPNHNMTFLANLNQHITTDTYSGCWGYVAPDSSEYAILGTHLGTAFIDITDNSNIHEVDFVATAFLGSGNLWREIKVYSHYAYVVSEETNCGVEIFDLQYLPDSVHLVRRFEPEGHLRTHSISQSGPYLLINGCNISFGFGVTILDLTVDPELPIKRGSLNTYYVHDARMVGDTIWAACFANGMRIIDAVNKDSLRFINSFLTPPHLAVHSSALTKDRKYVYTTDEAFSPTPGSLKIFDVQNVNSITFVRDWRPTNITTSQVHNIEIYGDTAVIAHRTAGIRVLDISNPVNPVEIAWYDTFPLNNNNIFSGAWGVYMFPSKKIIASNKENGLWVVQLGKQVKLNETFSKVIDFDLHQNYPNPFNPVTKIKFDITLDARRLPDGKAGETQDVKLVVYDAVGREVQTLVNQKLSSGSYDIEFSGNNFPSGLYYYRIAIHSDKLETDNFSEVKKMILLK